MDILQLPFELRWLIFSELEPEDVMRLRSVSKNFCNVASDEFLWLSICKRSFSNDVNKEIDVYQRRSWFRFYLEMRELEKVDKKSYTRLCELLMETRDSEVRARSLLYLDSIPFEISDDDLSIVSCTLSKFSVINTLKDSDANFIEEEIKTSLEKQKRKLDAQRREALSRKRVFISRWDR